MKTHFSNLILIAVATLTLSAPAFAHLDLGEYHGTTADGEYCSFTVKDAGFLANTPHPLNERITVDVNGHGLVLSHLPQVDTDRGRIGFDREHLSGTLGTSNGAIALIVTMEHSPSHHGPVSFTIVHEMSDSSATWKQTCLNLVAPKPAQGR